MSDIPTNTTAEDAATESPQLFAGDAPWLVSFREQVVSKYDTQVAPIRKILLEYQRLFETNFQLQRAHEKLQTQYRECKAELEQSSTRMSSFSGSTPLAADVIALQHKLLALNDDIKVMNENEAKRLKELYELKDHNHRLREETASAIAAKNELVADANAAKAAKAAADATISTLEDSISLLQSENQTLKVRLQDLLKQYESNAAVLSTRTSTETTVREQLAGELNSLTEECNNLRKELESARNRSKDYYVQLNESITEKLVLREKLAELQSTVDSLKEQIATGVTGTQESAPSPVTGVGALFENLFRKSSSATKGSGASKSSPAPSLSPNSSPYIPAGRGSVSSSFITPLQDSWVPVNFSDLPVPSKQKHRLQLRSKEITSLRFINAQSDRLLASSADGTVVLVDTDTSKTIGLFSTGLQNVSISCTAVASALGRGGLICGGADDRKVYCWDVATQRLDRTLVGHSRNVTSIEYIPPHPFEMTEDASGRSSGARPGSAGYATSSRGFIVTGSADQTVKLWDMRDKACVRTIVTKSSVAHLAVDPSGSVVWTANGDGAVRLFDLRQSGAMLASSLPLFSGAAANSLSLSPPGVDGGCMLLVSGRDHTIRVLDAATLQPLAHPSTQAKAEPEKPAVASIYDNIPDRRPSSANFRPMSNTLNSFLAGPPQEEFLVLRHEKYKSAGLYHRAVITPSGQYAVAGSAKGRIHAWRLPTGVYELEVTGQDKKARRTSTAAGTSSNSNTNIFGSAFSELDDVSEAPLEVTGHRSATVSTVAFSQDGNMMASGDSEGVVVIWENTVRSHRSGSL